MTNEIPKGSFIHEIPLRTNAYLEKKINIKFRALTELYNASLGETFQRHNDMIADIRYHNACEYYKKEDTRQQAIQLFNQLRKDHSLSKYDLQKFVQQCKKLGWMKDHLDSDTIQVISDRAFDAYDKWCFKKRGKPRFKPFFKGIRSIQGKKNACITYTKQGKIKWKDLQFDLVLDKKDKYGVQTHALHTASLEWKENYQDKDGNNKEKVLKGLKYCRIIRRFIKGKYRFYVQLVLRGKPKQKDNQKVGYGIEVGGDVGVSTLAVVSQHEAILVPFCENLTPINQEIKLIQRKMARSQRANNLDNFEKDKWIKKDKHYQRKKGKIIKGKKTWEKSNNYLKLQNELKELHRKQADKRQYEHNCLANQIIEMGNIIKFEKNNIKAWQKGWFGKTIGFRAPSNFITTLQRKVEKTGGNWNDINAWQAKLSQYCHVCNGYHKKTLAQRTHECNGKPIAQRDLYSAALALHYDLNEKKICITNENWQGLETVLDNAVQMLNINSRKGDNLPSCLVNNNILIEKRESHSKSREIKTD